MAAVGFSMGNLNGVLAAAKGRGVETLLNEFSSRLNPALVYLEDTRIVGEAAKPHSIARSNKTATNFFRLAGCKYDDPHAQNELKRCFFKHSKMEDGSIGIHLYYRGKETVYSADQVLAMYLTKLRSVAKADLGRDVGTAVLTCPPWYTESQRQGIENACKFGGLPLVRIMNDTTAAALAYAIYKNDLTEDPRYVIFVDCGESSTSTCVAAIYQGKMKIVGTVSDPYLGGRDIDDLITKKMAAEFKDKTKVDLYAKENARGLIRLTAECEKLKKLMSANVQSVPINMECLHGDFDFRSKMCREEMEDICGDLFSRYLKLFENTLPLLAGKAVHSVEVIGGCSRIPLVKDLISKTFGRPCSTTLNADECVARGAAWQAAFHSPTHRPREYSVTDCISHGIDLEWTTTDAEGKSMPCRKTVFDIGSSVPSSKMLTFNRSQPFEIKALYTDPNRNVCRQENLGMYSFPNVKPNKDGGDSTVKVKLRVNPSGLFSVEEAHSVEEISVPDPTDTSSTSTKPPGSPKAGRSTTPEPNMDVDTEAEKKQTSDNQSSTAQEEENNDEEDLLNMLDTTKAKAESALGPKMIKKTVKNAITVSKKTDSISDNRLKECMNLEAEMAYADELEFARANAKNLVEQLVYEIREKIYNAWQNYTDPDKVDEYSKICDELGDWLYDEGENCSKDIYDEKLAQLKEISEPLQHRAREAETRVKAIEDLEAAISIYSNIVRLHSQNDEKYNHIAAEDMHKVADACKKTEQWFNEKLSELNAQPKFVNPCVLTVDFLTHIKSLKAECRPIVNTPKAPPTPVHGAEENNDSNSNPNPPPPDVDADVDPEPSADAENKAKDNEMQVD